MDLLDKSLAVARDAATFYEFRQGETTKGIDEEQSVDMDIEEVVSPEEQA